jgi:hypothetical protein
MGILIKRGDAERRDDDRNKEEWEIRDGSEGRNEGLEMVLEF